jgi:hypothetical protein
MIAVRKTDEEQLRFQCVSVVDGRPVHLDGLAERLKAARMRNESGEITETLPAIADGHNRSGGRWEECLRERIRKARERVARVQSQDSTL